jgi:IS5 family transposase
MTAGRYAHAKQLNRHGNNCAFCASGSAGSSAIFAARSGATSNSKQRLSGCYLVPIRSARSSSASVAGSFIPFTLQRWSASAKARPARPYEFGVKASIVIGNGRAPGGQFVLHAKTLPGDEVQNLSRI